MTLTIGAVEAHQERLEELKAEIAARSKRSIDSPRVITTASLRLKHEQMIQDMLEGKSVDSARLVELTKAIDELEPPESIHVDLEIITSDGSIHTGPAELHHQVEGAQTGSNPFGYGERRQPQHTEHEGSVVWSSSGKVISLH
jgi:hypothetical protein